MLGFALNGWRGLDTRAPDGEERWCGARGENLNSALADNGVSL